LVAMEAAQSGKRNDPAGAGPFLREE
jgi:hypothetical protein